MELAALMTFVPVVRAAPNGAATPLAPDGLWLRTLGRRGSGTALDPRTDPHP